MAEVLLAIYITGFTLAGIMMRFSCPFSRKVRYAFVALWPIGFAMMFIFTFIDVNKYIKEEADE